jgi:TM2 domain-containing membrane protein YozV
MKCAVHPEVDATGFCRNCGKPMCPVCVRPVRDVLYCEDCLAMVMGVPSPNANTAQPGYATPPNPGENLPPSMMSSAGPPALLATLPPAQSKGAANPALAFLLGFVPGLGAIYNGEYNKALIHIVVFGAIILGLSTDIGEGMTGILVFMLVAFVFYMAIDATRVAKARQTGVMLADPFESWSKERPLGPIILIGVGALFLLNNFGFFDFFRVRQIFWPLVLIGIGVLMLRKRVGGQS